jgi:hypothetical protein
MCVNQSKTKYTLGLKLNSFDAEGIEVEHYPNRRKYKKTFN